VSFVLASDARKWLPDFNHAGAMTCGALRAGVDHAGHSRLPAQRSLTRVSAGQPNRKCPRGQGRSNCRPSACPARGHRVNGGPAGRRTRSAAPTTIDPATTHPGLAPTRKTGVDQAPEPLGTPPIPPSPVHRVALRLPAGNSWSLDGDRRENSQSAFALVRASKPSPNLVVRGRVELPTFRFSVLRMTVQDRL
jgi:hypothetical protein